ncbi:MAG TPA: hypothetical protein VGC77_14770 [Rhodopseudomonas sp.]|uniref:VOC family protein n=1 Tax=Rhodopseudomonas sp. TaxID=1078 RepID=UPI002EDA11AB
MKVLNILVRRCVPLQRFEAAVGFYEQLFGQSARLRFDYPERELKLAQVASLLIVAGSAQSLAPFVDTEATFLVDEIEAFAASLPGQGAAIERPLKAVPTGRNMLVRHPDGMLVEYVEHRDKHPADRMAE